MRCEHCGGELVEVDNPMRLEFRHRRGVVCSGMPRPPAQPSASGPNTPEGSTDRGTGISGPHARSEAAERCQPVYVHAYGFTPGQWDALFDRVADAAHALDELVSCSGGGARHLCEECDGTEPTDGDDEEDAYVAYDAPCQTCGTDANPEPSELAAIRDRVKSDTILTEAEIDGASSGWIELMQARRDRAALLSALDTELSEQTRPTGHLPRPDVAHDAPGAATPGDDERLTLDRVADVLGQWAHDLDIGARTDWPHGEPKTIRGIAIAAEWVRARARYEREVREQQADDPPCVPITIHTYGLTPEGWDALFDRVAAAAHRLDETVTCIGHNECATCDDTTE